MRVNKALAYPKRATKTTMVEGKRKQKGRGCKSNFTEPKVWQYIIMLLSDTV